MSIQNLFSSNDYTLHCNNMICNSITNNKAIYRYNLDPSSNPDPSIGGLIVTAAETSGFDFKVPLTLADQSLGIANPFSYDPQNHFTMSNNVITCHKTGNYTISYQMGVLSNLVTPNNVCIFQILLNGQNIFAAPPGVFGGGGFATLSGPPFTGLFNLGAFNCGSANVHLTEGQEITLKFYLAYDTCVLPLTGCLCITEL